MREKTRILVVDDEPTLREVLSDTLKSAGYECNASKGVDGALRLLAQEDFGLILTDIKMPGKNGIDLLKTVQASYPGIGVLWSRPSLISRRRSMR